MKLLIISSSGGHLYKTYLLKKWWTKSDRIWVTREDVFTKNLLNNEKTLYASFPDKRHNIINLIKNFILAYKIIRKEKPDFIFSTGAGVAISFFIWSKILRIKSIFLETFIFINHPTLTGKIIYQLNLSTIFLIQNKKLRITYPKAKYWGSIL